MLNKKAEGKDARFLIEAVHPCGRETMAAPLSDLATYNRDPDAYVAKKYGMTTDQYIEWIELHGAPLCGGTTKAGKPCKNMIGRIQMDPPEWLSKHREDYCTTHGD